MPGRSKATPADKHEALLEDPDFWEFEPLTDDDRDHFQLLQRLGYVEADADINDFRRRRPVVRH